MKERGLKENIFRWRRGHDRGLPQFINLESLLYLFNKAKLVRISIEKKVEATKIQLNNSNNRLEKTEKLISLIKDLRSILKGNNNMAKIFNVNSITLNGYINRKEIKSLPLNFAVKLIEFIENNILCFEFTIEELQNKITTYQAYHGKSIKPEFQGERNLPIKVTPEFESIIYHLMGDGHVKSIGSGEYTQLSNKGRKNFLNKLYSVFGYFELSEKSFNDGRVIIPKVIIDIICKYYNLNFNSFNWNTSKLPLNVSNNSDFKIAGLTAFIVDEGHVSDRGIEIYSGNQHLLSQIRSLAVDLGLDCSELKTKKASGNTKESFRFRIRKEGSLKLIQMINKLKENYPNCGLAQKENILDV